MVAVPLLIGIGLVAPFALGVWLAGRGLIGIIVLAALPALIAWCLATPASDTVYDMQLVLAPTGAAAAGVLARLVSFWLVEDRQRRAGPGELQRRVALLVFAIPTALIAYQFMIGWPINNVIMKFQALRIADGAPLCLQVSSPGNDPLGMLHPSALVSRAASEYTPVTTWGQLSDPRPTIDGMGDVAITFYAVMAVDRTSGTELYNWSYRKEDFERIPASYLRFGAKAETDCTPSPSFFEHLS